MSTPFKFLDSFTREDREIFFGREKEIEELYRKVFESKILLVYGISGTGKSSLIDCGLANKFQESDWLPIPVRRGGNVVESFATAIKQTALSAINFQVDTPKQFLKAIRSIYLDQYKPIYFIFDQFEELFIFGSAEERKSLAQLIKSIIESDLQCRFIISMREEYLAGITEFEKVIPSFYANRMRIEKMSLLNAVQAIEGPCRVQHIQLEEGFANALLERLSPESTEVELTFLQVALDRLYRGAQKQNKETVIFNKDLLKEVGNVSDLLGSFLDEQIAQLEDSDSALAVLKSFVSVKGTKRQMTSEEVQEYAHTLGKMIEEGTLQQLLQTFIHLRILRDKDQNNRYELRHDALAAKIYEKITLVEKELLEIRQLIENAYNAWEKRGVLLSSEDLQYVAPYESRLYLPDEQGRFIERSKKELVKVRHRRRQIISITVFILIIILGGFTVWALRERRNAIEKEKIAKAEKIRATASAQEALIARDNALESDRKAVASEKEALSARDRAEASEFKARKEKLIAEGKEIQARASNFNFLSKEVASENPTIALRLALYALSLDSGSGAIRNNLNRIYYDNSFYRIFYKDENASFLQISPDRKTIIAVNGRTARLTDLKGKNPHYLIGHVIHQFTLNVHTVFRGGYDNIVCLAFSPDGSSVVTGSYDVTARLWDLQGNSMQLFTGHFYPVRAVAFSPDGKSIVTGSMDQTARLWDLKGTCRQVFTGHKGVLLSVSFSPDGQTILTGASDSTAILWDLHGSVLKRFIGHEGEVTKVSFSPDGRSVLTGSSDMTARLWDMNGSALQIFTGHQDAITSLVFSPDGKTILTGSADKTVRLWDLKGNQLQVFSGHNGRVKGIDFSPDGQSVLTSSGDGCYRIWDISQRNYSSLTGHENYVYRALYSPDGKTILTLSRDQSAKLWNTDGTCFRTFKLSSNAVAFSPDGKTVLTGFLTAQLLDLTGKSLQVFTGHTQQIRAVAFSPDGKTVLTGSLDKTARMWDRNGKILRIFNGHELGLTSVAYSPDGNLILTGSSDKTARLWNLNGELLQIFRGHDEAVNWVAFSPNGKTILTGSDDKTARLWNLDGTTLQVFAGHAQEVNSVAFSSDGSTIATGSDDKTTRLWDMKGNTLQIVSGQKGIIYSVAFAPDGKTLLTAAGDNTARLTTLKESLNQYLTQNAFEDLNLSQRLTYGTIQPGDLLNAGDVSEITDGLRYCLSQAKLEKYKRDLYLEWANKLYNSLSKKVKTTEERKSFISLGLDLYMLHPQKSIADAIEKANLQLTKASSLDELKEVYDFYSEICSSLDSSRIVLKMPEYFFQLAGNLASLDTIARHTISMDLSGLSWSLLQNRKFKASLDAARFSAESDSMNPYACITLPLALVLNDHFDQASQLYLKYSNSYMYGNMYKSYRLIYLQDMDALETKGIAHPDFARVRNLLQK
jgi:WD40 repeat protein